MNSKNLFVGIGLAGITLLSLCAEANAFSFRFLTSTANGNYTDYKFEFTADAGDTVQPNQELSVDGFLNVQSASLEDPVNNVAGILFADDAFVVGSFTVGGTVARFNTISNLSDFTGPVLFQTFVVTAEDVPNGFVNPSFDGNNLSPVAVPEPLTLLGAATAVGFGAFFKRRASKSISGMKLK